MELSLIFDHRFYTSENGKIFSLKHYNYDFFHSRYLGVFDSIKIYTRVSPLCPSGYHPKEFTVGPGVEVIPITDWTSASGIFSLVKTSNLVNRIIKGDSAICIIAGMLGNIYAPQIVKHNRPYAVEVVGDPDLLFSPGAMKHPVRPLLRAWFVRQLKYMCAHACASIYVTREVLQRKYPCPGLSAGISDVYIPEDAFITCARNDISGRNLIMVGSLQQQFVKAPDVLIRAFALCCDDGYDLTLTFVGDGKHRHSLEQLADECGVTDRIRFTGNLPSGDAVRAELNRADLFVLPSRTEGLPRAMIEAMACGLPCIGSAVGGIPELLAPEDLVPPGDIEELACKIREVVSSKDRMVAMSRRNLQVAQSYRDDVLSDRRNAFYLNLRENTKDWLAKCIR